MSHNEPEHICGFDCVKHLDTTKDFTLTIYKCLDDTSLSAKEWHFMFSGILFGLEMVVENEQITIPINNARTLAKILFKLEEQLSVDYHITSYSFNSTGNNLTVEIGEY